MRPLGYSHSRYGYRLEGLQAIGYRAVGYRLKAIGYGYRPKAIGHSIGAIGVIGAIGYRPPRFGILENLLGVYVDGIDGVD